MRATFAIVYMSGKYIGGVRLVGVVKGDSTYLSSLNFRRGGIAKHQLILSVYHRPYER